MPGSQETEQDKPKKKKSLPQPKVVKLPPPVITSNIGGDKQGGVFNAPPPKAQAPYQPATSQAVQPQQYPGIPGYKPPVNPNATGGSLAGDKQGQLKPSGYQHAGSAWSNLGPSPTQGAQDLRTLFNPPGPYPGIPQAAPQAKITTGGSLAGDKQGGEFNPPSSIASGDKQGQLASGTGQGTVGNASSANVNYSHYLTYEQRVADVSYAFQNFTGAQNSAIPNVAQPGDRNVLPDFMIASNQEGGYTPWTQYADANGNPFPSERAFMDFMGYADIGGGIYQKMDFGGNQGYDGGNGDYGGGWGFGGGGSRGSPGPAGMLIWHIGP